MAPSGQVDATLGGEEGVQDGVPSGRELPSVEAGELVFEKVSVAEHARV